MSKDTPGAIAEAFEWKLDKVLEVVESLRPTIEIIPEMYERLHVVEENMLTIKRALAATNKDVKRFDKSIGKVEHRLEAIDSHLSDLQKTVANQARDTHDEQSNLTRRMAKLEVQFS